MPAHTSDNQKRQKPKHNRPYGLLWICGPLLLVLICFASVFFLTTCAKQAQIEYPNVILITLDTTRADHLGCYGYFRKTSPFIDKFAAESVVYTNAIATSSWTLPAHASLFTGKFTTSHGARFDKDGPLRLSDAVEKGRAHFRARGLSPNELTLAEILKQAGFSTAGIVGGPWMKKIFGLDKGFDHYDDSGINTGAGRLAVSITDSAIAWLEKPRENPFFLFLNYFDPHSPYLPPADFATAFSPDLAKRANQAAKRRTEVEKSPKMKIALYDAEILYMDFHLNRFLEKLKIEEIYDNTMIIMVADHGEHLGRHGKFGHGRDLFQSVIHVPLIVKYPGDEVPPGREKAKVQLIDVFAMILDRLQIQLPDSVQGEVPPIINHPIIAEVYPTGIASTRGDWRAIIEGDYKCIWNSKGRHEFYNLKSDPGELRNATIRERKIRDRMLATMNQYLAALPKPAPISADQTVDKKTMDALKSLGYLE